MNLFTIDHLIVYVFLAITLGIGLYSGIGIKTTKEYAIADRAFNPTILTLTLLATALGSGDTYGMTIEILDAGIIFPIASFSIVICMLFVSKIASVLADKKFSDMISVADIIGFYYGKKAEMLTGILGFFYSAGVLGIQITTCAYIMSYVFLINYIVAVALAGGIIVVYSGFGGIKSVTNTDVMQFIALVIILPTIILATIGQVEQQVYFDYFHQSLNDTTNRQMINHIALFLFWLMPFHFFYPAMVQRFLMARDKNQIINSLYIFAGVFFVLIILMTLFTIAGHHLYPDVHSNELMPMLIKNMDIFIKGLAVVGMLAVIMSTSDSFLNSAGILCIQNVIVPLFGNIKQELLLIRLITFAIGLIAIVIAINQFSIMQMMSVVDGTWGALVGVPLVFALLGMKVNVRAYFITIFMSFSSFLYFYFQEYDSYIPSFISILISIFTFLISHSIIEGKIKFTPQQKEIKEHKIQQLVLEFATIIIKPFLLFEICERKVKQLKINYYTSSLILWFFSLITLLLYASHQYNSHNFYGFFVLAGVLCSIFIIKDKLPNVLSRYIPVIWFFTVMYCLLFLNTLILNIGVDNQYEIIILSFAIISTALLVDSKSFLILSFIGITSGYYVGRMYNDVTPTSINDPSNILIIIICGIITITILLLRPKEQGFKKFITTMEAFGGTMAHEVKTPLSSNQSSLSLMESIMDEEMKITKKAKTLNLEISEDNYKVMRYAMELMKKSNKSGKETVDMLLMSMKEGGELQGRKDQLSLKVCIDEALEEYGFERNQREQVRIKVENDISFIGDKEHIKHIIFNLIKNTFKHGGSDVNIEMIIEGDRLRFKDNGMGIPADKLPKIFDRFYTGSNTGTGLGLSFSKDIMKSIGGTIECESKEGEYTEFILDFSINLESKK